MVHVIAKRTILFRVEKPGTATQVIRQHLVEVSRGINDVREVPDWVTETPAFRHAVETGELTLWQQVGLPVTKAIPYSTAADPGFLKSAGDKPTVRDGVSGKPVETKTAEVQKPVIELHKLTKPQLVDHAEEVYGLKLDEKLSKPEMIEAIEEAATAPKSE